MFQRQMNIDVRYNRRNQQFLNTWDEYHVKKRR